MPSYNTLTKALENMQFSKPKSFRKWPWAHTRNALSEPPTTIIPPSSPSSPILGAFSSSKRQNLNTTEEISPTDSHAPTTLSGSSEFATVGSNTTRSTGFGTMGTDGGSTNPTSGSSNNHVDLDVLWKQRASVRIVTPEGLKKVKEDERGSSVEDNGGGEGDNLRTKESTLEEETGKIVRGGFSEEVRPEDAMTPSPVVSTLYASSNASLPVVQSNEIEDWVDGIRIKSPPPPSPPTSGKEEEKQPVDNTIAITTTTTATSGNTATPTEEEKRKGEERAYSFTSPDFPNYTITTHDLHRQLSRAYADRKKTNKYVTELEDKILLLKKTISDDKIVKEEMGITISELEEEVARLKRELVECEEEVGDKREEIDGLKDENEELKRKLRVVEGEKEERGREVERLRETNMTLREMIWYRRE